MKLRLASACLALVLPTGAQTPGSVLSDEILAPAAGGFTGLVEPGDFFGMTVAPIGDLDGNGAVDLLVGAPYADTSNFNEGAVWVLFLDSGGDVLSQVEIPNDGGLGYPEATYQTFGSSACLLGDLTGDGTVEVAVGSAHDSTGGSSRGAVLILSLAADGTPTSVVKIASGLGGFSGDLMNGDALGVSIAAVGDLDGDGVPEIAAGAFGNDDGASFAGAVWILYLNADGTVKAQREIAHGEAGFPPVLDEMDAFGRSVAGIGDLDGDGVPDLAVGAELDDDGGENRGAVWILFLRPNGTVKGQRKISDLAGDFAGALDDLDGFGHSLGSLGDLDGDGVTDLAVGAWQDGDGGWMTGAVWILFLTSAGGVRDHVKISASSGGLQGPIGGDRFGASVAAAADYDGDGVAELFVGEQMSDAGAFTGGAVWRLNLARGLAGDTSSLSLAAGGALQLDLDAGAPHALETYLVVGSLAGTTPGLPLGTWTLPLNPDAYTVHAAASPGQPPLAGGLGVLDAVGRASAVFTLPSGLSPSLAGQSVSHAFVTLGGSPIAFASNAATVELIP